MDGVHAEVAAVGHCVEELANELREALRLAVGLLDNPAEQVFRQQADILGEEAEDHTVEKVSYGRRVELAFAHPLGNLRELAGGFRGDGCAGDAGLELVRFVKDTTEDFQVASRGQLGERNLVGLGDRGREIGMDDQPIHVTHNQQRRVLQCLAVQEKLVIGGVQVLVLAFVLPAEEVAFPDVGPAVAAAVLGRAALKREPFTRGIDIGRFGMVEHFAQVKEVLLGGTAFGEANTFPFGDEILWRHGKARL